MGNDSNGGGAGMLSSLMASKGFWEVAFVVALLLLIFSHKITIEGMIGGSAA